MSNDAILIHARIHMLTAVEGGRSTPLIGGTPYRPNHHFLAAGDDRMCMGAIDLAEGESLAPGGTIERDILMWIWPELKGSIRPGQEWAIREGAQLVGHGTVIAVLESG